MSQEKIINSIVKSFINESRNKIVIACSDICNYTSEEFGSELFPKSLSKAITAFKDRDANENDERIIDAAIGLCHRISNRCWGQSADEEEDELSEIDISTEWSDFDSENPADLFVTIYKY